MEQYPNKIGKAMIVLAWIVFLGLLSFVFNDFLEQQNNPNQDLKSNSNQEARRVELQRNRYGHYVATGKINNREVTFLLDTGATWVSIPEPVAKDLKLKAGYANQVQTANGVITVYQTKINTIQLGDIILYGVRAHINPYMQGEEILLGMSFLKELEFYQQGDKLTIIQSNF